MGHSTRVSPDKKQEALRKKIAGDFKLHTGTLTNNKRLAHATNNPPSVLVLQDNSTDTSASSAQ
jgi:hypothetical protein